MLPTALRLALLVATVTLAATTLDSRTSAAASEQQPPSDVKFSAGLGHTDGMFYKALVENFAGGELVIGLKRIGNDVTPVVHVNLITGEGSVRNNSSAFLRRYTGKQLAKVYLDFRDRRSTDGNPYLNKIVKNSVEKFCATEPTDQNIANIQLQRPMSGKSEIISYEVDVLSVVDYGLFKKLGTAENLVNYLRIYWNMVDKRFRTLRDVRIKIVLKAIMYSSSPSIDTLLLDSHDPLEARVDTSKVKFSEAVAGFRGIFDVAHLITSRRLYTVENGIRRYGAFGAAYSISSACNVTSKAAYNSGIAEDDGIFGGVLHSAHVIAHNLGAHHDGAKPAENCFEGNIMSPLKFLNSSENFLFSSCSASAMSDMYFKKGAECLHSSSRDRFEYPEVLPGTIMSLITQCSLKTRIPFAVHHTGILASEHCVDLACQFWAFSAAFTVHANTAALDGSQCDEDAYCHDGQCLTQAEIQ